MSSLCLLADHEAATINGGLFSTFNFTSFSWKSASTNLGQQNSATNVGLGLLGLGSATSFQQNVAGVSTVIG